MFDFTGKYAVVTGGAKGIGRALVRRYIREGAAGAAILDVEDCAMFAKEIDPSGDKVLPIYCDISDSAAVAAAFHRIYGKFKRVDFLVNCAGICRNKLFHEINEGEWDQMLDTNLKGAYNCTKQVINPMRDQEYGRIVFLSSIGTYGARGQTHYSAAKGALYTMTKNLAGEQIGKNITVNCILPGPIDTDMLRDIATVDPIAVAERRIGQPEDVASLICYLCTDEAYFINGARIDVNGGIR
ncbi:MAG: SDR family oxidoreductase [Clostridiales bacterium]|nr:SDR family oxidoreductase [Clostridiales bacterium]